MDEIRDDVRLVGQAAPDGQGQGHVTPPPLPQAEGGPEPEPQEVVENEFEISEELSAEVFENDMLREIILEYVIYSKGKVCRPDMKNLRLVRKKWLRTTTDSMLKFRDPMFTLTLDKDLSKILDDFAHDMTSSIQLNLSDRIPPFSLKLLPNFFSKENLLSLSNCLSSCGDGIVACHLSFPLNNPMALVLPSFHLPRLQHLAVEFSDHRLLGDPTAEYHSNALIQPLQKILDGTNKLKELIFEFNASEVMIPVGFSNLALPKTVTSLHLECSVKCDHLDMLINKDLNLTSLRLFATDRPASDETIYEILQKFRTTLRSLGLHSRHDYRGDYPEMSTLFKFPVMEKLESLEVTSPCWELEENLSHLESQLPKLRELRILNTTDSMFSKWTDKSRFEAVKSLFVSLYNSTDGVGEEAPIEITLEKIQRLNWAFPNVVSLDMMLYRPLVSVLNYVFMEMRLLENLVLIMKGKAGEQLHADHWDSVLIGVPREVVTCFRMYPECLEIGDLKDANDVPSIRKLTSLKSLALVDVDQFSESVLDDDGDAIISDLSFHFGFLKMPQLKKLVLHGRFAASMEMTERWRQEKGTEIVQKITS